MRSNVLVYISHTSQRSIMFNAIVYVHIRQIDGVTIVISRKKVRHVLWYEVTE